MSCVFEYRTAFQVHEYCRYFVHICTIAGSWSGYPPPLKMKTFQGMREFYDTPVENILGIHALFLQGRRGCIAGMQDERVGANRRGVGERQVTF